MESACIPDTAKGRTMWNLHDSPNSTATVRLFGAFAACVIVATALIACNVRDEDEQAPTLEATILSLEASIAVLEDENAALKGEIAALRQEQTDFVEAQEAAEAAREHEEEVADFEEEQEEQIAALEEGQARTGERLDDLDFRVRELEEVTAKLESAWPDKEEWSDDKNEKSSPPEDMVVERTAKLAEESGGKVHYVDHPGRGDRTVLVTPLEFADGETPLIVSLHGFGGNSADHAAYIPLHERVAADRFALLLPNGTVNSEGNRFWNPTDECCEGGKSGEDDVAYLTELVAEARKVKNFGPVYFFGYSNGGFMAHHMACKGMPGLRAVASLAGTSYVDDASCAGAPPVSALHIHGTDDGVILFDGDESEPDPKGDGKTAFYLGASEITARWSRKAGCDWPEHFRTYSALDLDQYVPGSETQAFRLDPDCAEGITVELWIGEGSGHSPAYGDAFLDALLDWLLSQK